MGILLKLRAMVETKSLSPNKARAKIKELIDLAYIEKRRLERVLSDGDALTKELKEWHNNRAKVYSGEQRREFEKRFRAIYNNIKKLEWFQKFDTKKVVELLESTYAMDTRGGSGSTGVIQDLRLRQLEETQTLTMDKLVERALAYHRYSLHQYKLGKGSLFGFNYEFFNGLLEKLFEIVNTELNEINEQIQRLSTLMQKLS